MTNTSEMTNEELKQAYETIKTNKKFDTESWDQLFVIEKEMYARKLLFVAVYSED